MRPAVIDTNVLLVANGSHAGVSATCRIGCVSALRGRRAAGVVVVDDARRIVGEYLRKTRPNRPKGVGDVFLKRLLQKLANHARVHCVTLTETRADEFAEFPGEDLQAAFDVADRKFVAVANAHPQAPPIWQAADSKWLGWWEELDALGVRVAFPCPDDVRRAYHGKFPRRAVTDPPTDL